MGKRLREQKQLERKQEKEERRAQRRAEKREGGSGTRPSSPIEEASEVAITEATEGGV
jgi:hypothetical protein